MKNNRNAERRRRQNLGAEGAEHRGAVGAENRGAEGAEGVGVWEGVSPSQPTIGGLGKRRELPQRGPGRSPGRKRFSVNFPLQKRC